MRYVQCSDRLIRRLHAKRSDDCLLTSTMVSIRYGASSTLLVTPVPVNFHFLLVTQSGVGGLVTLEYQAQTMKPIASGATAGFQLTHPIQT
jgi:hypothetical protein